MDTVELIIKISEFADSRKSFEKNFIISLKNGKTIKAAGFQKAQNSIFGKTLDGKSSFKVSVHEMDDINVLTGARRTSIKKKHRKGYYRGGRKKTETTNLADFPTFSVNTSRSLSVE
jgi:hypothetical protein